MLTSVGCSLQMHNSFMHIPTFPEHVSSCVPQEKLYGVPGRAVAFHLVCTNNTFYFRYFHGVLCGGYGNCFITCFKLQTFCFTLFCFVGCRILQSEICKIFLSFSFVLNRCLTRLISTILFALLKLNISEEIYFKSFISG